jgi:hypothetical protein
MEARPGEKHVEPRERGRIDAALASAAQAARRAAQLDEGLRPGERRGDETPALRGIDLLAAHLPQIVRDERERLAG